MHVDTESPTACPVNWVLPTFHKVAAESTPDRVSLSVQLHIVIDGETSEPTWTADMWRPTCRFSVSLKDRHLSGSRGDSHGAGMPVVRRSSALRCSVLVGVVATWLVGARAIAGEAQLRAPSEALLGSDPLRSQTRVREDGSKLVIGYIYNLYKYDPHGGAQPLPPGVANAAELLEVCGASLALSP